MPLYVSSRTLLKAMLLMSLLILQSLLCVVGVAGQTTTTSTSTMMIRRPSKSECAKLVAAVENACETEELQTFCAGTCQLQQEQSLAEKFGTSLLPPNNAYDTTSSFYDLSADDIDQQPLHFDKFRGDVVLVTNVASYCGYTESHYKELNMLYSKYRHRGFHILAFPCNQFEEQEPGLPEEIKGFCQRRGVEFQMMDKIFVNGHETHPVYRYLKRMAGPERIDWNFSTYYLIGRSGHVRSFHGERPKSLKKFIVSALESPVVWEKTHVSK